MGKPAVFLDRDGTLNVEKNYLYRLEDWEWIPGAIDAIRSFNKAGFLVIVITNQAGIARGMYGESDVRLLHQQIDKVLASSDAHIDAYYFCPHHPEYGDKTVCDCRKPAPGMILQAQKDWDIDLSHSYMVGDKLADVQASLAAGVMPILVATGYGSEARALIGPEVPCMTDIGAAARLILNSRAQTSYGKRGA